MPQQLSLFNDPNCSFLNISLKEASCSDGNPIAATCENSTISVTVCKSFQNLNYSLPSSVISSSKLSACRPIALQAGNPVLFINQSCGQTGFYSKTVVASPSSLQAQSAQGISVGTIIGISIGCIAFVVFILFMIWYFKVIKKMLAKDKKEPIIIETHQNAQPTASDISSSTQSNAIYAAHQHFKRISRDARHSQHDPRNTYNTSSPEPCLSSEELILAFQDFANTALLLHLDHTISFPLKFPDPEVQKFYEQGQLITSVYRCIKDCQHDDFDITNILTMLTSLYPIPSISISKMELLIKRGISFFQIYKTLKARLFICGVDQRFDPERHEWMGDTTSTIFSLVPGLELNGEVVIKEIVTTRAWSEFKIW